MRPQLPRGCAPFLDLVHVLRRNGFAVSPDQTEGFLAAVTLLGPRSMEHIRRAAIATLAPAIERMDAFDTLFRAVFFGEARAAATGGEDEEETVVKDRGAAEMGGEAPLQQEKGGAHASEIERLAARDIAAGDRLKRFRDQLPDALPRRRAFRRLRTRTRGAVDLRRTLREIVRTDGDLAAPRLARRQEIARRIVLLLDISGSMRTHTDELVTLAHAVRQAAPRAEAFTIGTRLTRITPALRLRDRAQALARTAALVDDWNGGTRIGPALKAFLAVPRFAALARGALVVLASDGLERGGHQDFEAAMRRLSGLAHRLSLATPLAGDPRFRPETAALAAVLPALDDLVDGSSAQAIADFILTLNRPAPKASAVWKETPHAACR